MRVWTESYGCTLNQGEALMLKELALRSGHVEASSPGDADIIILGTCIVIDTTERKMWKRLENLAEETAKGKQVMVGGCLPPIYEDRLRELFPDVIIAPPGRMETAAQHFDSQCPEDLLVPSVQGITAVLPISTGCMGDCTYCVTHLARGMLVSRPPGQILEWAKMAVDKGAKELRLSAQDTGVYGAEMRDGADLPRLLHSLSEIPGDFMIRVGMMNPGALEKIKEGMAQAYNCGKFYRFLHMPVQSGSDKVLAAMGRNYTAEGALALANEMRKRVPGLTISTDIIVGFPGETEEDFRKSMDLVERMQPNIVNVTRFSPRPGTSAEKMKNQVVGWRAKEWSRELTELRFRISREKHAHLMGHEARALVVEKGTVEGTMVARTENYLPVVIKDQSVGLGEWIELRFTRLEDSYLYGKII